MRTARVNNPSQIADECIATAGEFFPDGAALDLISAKPGSNPDLVLWKAGTATRERYVEHRRRQYKALDIDPSVLRVVRLPNRWVDYGSTRQLFARVARIFQQYLSLLKNESALLTYFSISTWFAEVLPSAPWLSIRGLDPSPAINLLRLLGSVCRRALLLADITPRTLRSLPLTLRPTLLISQPDMSRRMDALMRASNYRGFYIPGANGTILDAYFPRATFIGTGEADNSGDTALQISLEPAQFIPPNLNERCLEQIASELQPQLLMYRLRNWQKVQGSDFDCAGFDFRTRQLARILGACVPDDVELTENLVTLLGPQDEDSRTRSDTDVLAVVTEVVLAYLHSSELTEAPVAKICKDTNVILRIRGELHEYSPVEIGWRLRALGIRRHRSSKNHVVVLSRDLSRRVHHLAQLYGVASVKRECPECVPRK